MKLINTIVAITFASLLANTAIATPHQKLAMLTPEPPSAFSVKKTSKKTSSKKKVRGWSCLRSVETVRRKARKIDAIINKSAQRYSVDSNLIRAVIAVESCYNARAVSPAGAQGLMQLIPATADRFGVTNSFDVKQNINAGTKYLRFLSKRFNGDLRKVTAGYNAGEGRVDQYSHAPYNGVPPYKETRNYVKNVLRIYGELSGNYTQASLDDNGLVNRNPASYKGMSAEKKAILSRINSLGVKSSYPNKRAIVHKKQLAKKTAKRKLTRAKPVYKGGLRFTRDRVINPDISHLSPRRQKAIKRLQLLQKKLRLRTDQSSGTRVKSTSRRMIIKPGREGWKSNRQGAARLYKKR
jgi:hypothetical protein